jgi:hypothetical protein
LKSGSLETDQISCYLELALLMWVLVDQAPC